MEREELERNFDFLDLLNVGSRSLDRLPFSIPQVRVRFSNIHLLAVLWGHFCPCPLGQDGGTRAPIIYSASSVRGMLGRRRFTRLWGREAYFLGNAVTEQPGVG